MKLKDGYIRCVHVLLTEYTEEFLEVVFCVDFHYPMRILIFPITAIVFIQNQSLTYRRL